MRTGDMKRTVRREPRLYHADAVRIVRGNAVESGSPAFAAQQRGRAYNLLTICFIIIDYRCLTINYEEIIPLIMYAVTA